MAVSLSNICLTVPLKVLSSRLNWGMGGETRLIRSAVKNWKPSKSLKKFLMIQSHERSIKSFQRLKYFWDDFVPLKSFSGIFQSTESQFKNSYQFRLRTSRNHSSPEDDFRQLVSSDPLFRFSKMTFRHHQIRWLSVAKPIPACHKPELTRPRKVTSVIRWRRKMTSRACSIPAWRKPELARPRQVILWQAGIAKAIL